MRMAEKTAGTEDRNGGFKDGLTKLLFVCVSIFFRSCPDIDLQHAKRAASAPSCGPISRFFEFSYCILPKPQRDLAALRPSF